METLAEREIEMKNCSVDRSDCKNALNVRRESITVER